MTDPTDPKQATPACPPIRPAHDAEDDRRLKRDPANEDAKLDVALDESFPSSDPPALIQPKNGKDPPPEPDAAEKDRG